jgi:4-amino-4-deoxy-L-arabinose transferase-like glycosyltransferase
LAIGSTVMLEGLLITALAVALRLGWVLLVPTHPVGDFAMYLESADHLVAHGALDPAYIYMPGYVVLLAGVRALGGGLLAVKLIGVAAGGLATAACYGTAYALFNREVARLSGLLAALWPAGIAVASVTGTDMPAAALLATAVWMLVRDRGRRPIRAAILFGLFLGLTATIRAVALPLALLGGCYWLALGVAPRKVLGRTAIGVAVAFLVLVPWGVRNRLRYGELFFTDSHGGHTALVGANPNSEGVYSRSLNRMFAKGTGFELFAEPHREADRQAYALAVRLVRFEPLYAVGLLAAKADRLLTHERPLLYWPLYRQGVLAGGAADFFARNRARLEAVADFFWYGLVAAALIGVTVSLTRRVWAAVALLPIPLALGAVYVVFFAEVRYHLAVAVLLFPYAGLALGWLARGLRILALRRGRESRYFACELLIGGLLTAGVFIGWPRLVASGAALRARHRFAVSVCSLDDHGRICLWRAGAPPPAGGRSPLRGVWDGVGISTDRGPASAVTDVDLPAGHYRVSALADLPGSAGGPSASLVLRLRGTQLASVSLTPGGAPAPVEGTVNHPGGPLHLEVAAAPISVAAEAHPAPHPGPATEPASKPAPKPGPKPAPKPAPATVWVSDLKIVSDLH